MYKGRRRSVNWLDKLGKDCQGSRPRCVLLTDGCREDVAKRLTKLIDFPGVSVSSNDKWRPCGKGSVEEAQLHKSDILPRVIRNELKNWWLAISKNTTTTPNWDIASTCTIEGDPALLLVEAKAHNKELDGSGKILSGSQRKNPNSRKNYERIREAIEEANEGLKSATSGSWSLSSCSHYQLSNRFAWAWKLASLGKPVILLYLGFLKANEMTDRGASFSDGEDWERHLRNHCRGVVDSTFWGKNISIKGVPLIPLIRAKNQPFAEK